MDTSIAHMQAVFDTVFTQIATTTSRTMGCLTRPTQAKLSMADLVKTLVFTVLAAPTPSLTQYAETATTLGIAISPQAVDQRLTDTTADWLAHLVSVALTCRVGGAPLTLDRIHRFPGGIVIQDSTQITLPASWPDPWQGGGNQHGRATATLKLQCCRDLRTGTVTGQMTHGRSPDQNAHLTTDLRPDTLYLADLGYWSVRHLADLSRRSIGWISRMDSSTLVYHAHGGWQDIDVLLRAQPATVTTLDLSILLGKTARLPARMVAVRCPNEVIAKRMIRVRKNAKRKNRPVSLRQCTLAAWTIFMTNQPATTMTHEEVWMFARARWQIELLFKTWKSDGRITQHQNVRVARQRCEFYARLLAMLLQQWVMAVCQPPDRVISLPKAARQIRQRAIDLLDRLRCPERLTDLITQLRICIRAHGRGSTRKKHPSFQQLLENPSLLILA